MKQFNEEKMFTFLRGFFVGADLKESTKALGYARDKHKDQTRKDGTPYIIHPLEMTCYAIGLGIREDTILATILLHDVCEDCNTPVEELPFSSEVRRGVKLMTINIYPNETKTSAKTRYFNEIIESKESVIAKGIDRYMNLSTSAGVMSIDSIRKNVKETNEMLLPILKLAKEKYPELDNTLFVLRANLSHMCNTLTAAYHL